MTRYDCTYMGGFRCQGQVVDNGAVVVTDVAAADGGRGEYASPTDLLAIALGHCLLSLMAYADKKGEMHLEQTRIEIVKEMAGGPVRIIALRATAHMPAGLSPAQRGKLEQYARRCPVHASLSGEIDAPITFVYPD